MDTFAEMKSQLESEKRSMTKIWNAREKQIERVLDSTVGMQGQLEGIIGKAMLPLQSLELGAGSGGEPDACN